MLHKLQIVNTLATTKLLSTIALHMRNFIANFVRILGICKEFAGNRVNEHGNVPRDVVLFLNSTNRCNILLCAMQSNQKNRENRAYSCNF